MDFASLMSAAISKDRSTSSPAPQSESSKKYLKRAEIEAQRQQAYIDEQAAIQREREAKLSKKRKLEDEEASRTAERDEKRRRMAEESRIRRDEEEARKERARRKRLGLPDLPDKTSEEADGSQVSSKEDIPDEELLLKLRALSEPTILFGETHRQRLHRYRTLTTIAPSKPPQTTGPIPTTLELVPEADMKVPPTVPKTPESKTFLFRQLASYFTMILTEWSRALSARPASVKESSQGRTAYNAMQQSLTAMIPLFRHFERADLEDSMLAPLLEIVSAAQERRYVDANDGYLRLSIGKAAWPIGVTMVGIHERSAREKLHESDKGAAHIMSDEGTRKWLQSIKRCLSFAQTRWPPEDMMQLMG